MAFAQVGHLVLLSPMATTPDYVVEVRTVARRPWSITLSGTCDLGLPAFSLPVENVMRPRQNKRRKTAQLLSGMCDLATFSLFIASSLQPAASGSANDSARPPSPPSPFFRPQYSSLSFLFLLVQAESL